jgi:hypothetical protein
MVRVGRRAPGAVGGSVGGLGRGNDMKSVEV